MEKTVELTKSNSDRAIKYTKQLKQARRKEIRLKSRLLDLSKPRKVADPVYKNRTGVKHVGYGAFQSFYGTAL